MSYVLYMETGDSVRDTAKKEQMSGTLEECTREFEKLLSSVGMRTHISLGFFSVSIVIAGVSIERDGVVVQSARSIGDNDKRYKRCQLVKPDGTKIKFINDKDTGATHYSGMTMPRSARSAVDYFLYLPTPPKREPFKLPGHSDAEYEAYKQSQLTQS